MWIGGVFTVAFGVALCSAAGLGVSMIAAPAFIVAEALDPVLPWLSVGMAEYFYQGIVLAAMCLITRRFDFRYLLSFLVAVVYGYVLDMWLAVLGFSDGMRIWERYLLLGAGIACVSLGVTFFFRTYLPMEVYELFVAETAKRFDLRTEKMKLYYDLSQLAITLTLAFTLFDPSDFDWRGIYATAYHSLGPGTVLATFLNAPLIALFGKAADRLFGYGALFPGLKKHLAVPYAKKTSSEKEGDGSDCA